MRGKVGESPNVLLAPLISTSRRECDYSCALPKTLCDDI